MKTGMLVLFLLGISLDATAAGVDRKPAISQVMPDVKFELLYDKDGNPRACINDGDGTVTEIDNYDADLCPNGGGGGGGGGPGH